MEIESETMETRGKNNGTFAKSALYTRKRNVKRSLWASARSYQGGLAQKALVDREICLENFFATQGSWLNFRISIRKPN